MASVLSSFICILLLSLTSCSTSTNLDWIYQEYCLPPANVNVYCDKEYGKVYVFVAERKDYESARQSCKDLFKSLDSAELISFQDCKEYQKVQRMLMSITQEDTSLWKEVDEEGLGMDIWTGTYDIPRPRRKRAETAGHSVHYEITEALDLSQLCNNHSDSNEDDFVSMTTTATVKTTAVMKLNSNGSTSEGVNFTANFVPWDNNEEDERYPMCEFKFPPDFSLMTTDEGHQHKDREDDTLLESSRKWHHQQDDEYEGHKKRKHHRDWSRQYYNLSKHLPWMRHRSYFKWWDIKWWDETERSHIINMIVDQNTENEPKKFRKLTPVEAVGEIAQTIEENKDNISASDIFLTMDYVRHLHEKLVADSDVDEVKAVNFSKSVLKGFSIFLEKDSAWNEMPESERTETAVNLLSHVQQLSYTIGCSMFDDHQAISDSNIQMETFRMQKGVIQRNFMFPASHDPKSKESTGIHFTEDVPVTTTSACNQHLVSGVLYRKLSTRMVSAGNLNDDLENVTLDDLKREQSKKTVTHIMNSHLLSFTLSNTNESVQLPDSARIRLSFPHLTPLEFGDESRCVFWDVNTTSWSDHRCYPVEDESSRGKTVCECDHLTNFAVLMDISNRETNDQVKSLLTLICCAASVIGLTATVVATVMVKSLRNRRSVITANLSMCLLVTNLLVILGFDQTDNVAVCRIISGIILFALLSAFFWMLMEGYLLYQMIILVFQSIGYINTTTLYFFGYTPSLIILTIFIAVTGFEGLYDPDHSFFCWISNRSHPMRIWAFAGPAFTIIFVNALILIKSFIAALKSQKSKKPPQSLRQTDSDTDRAMRMQVIRRWLKGWTSLFILVGLTWIIGLVYIHHAVFWFSYVFIVLNGLQGLFIFLFEIVFNGKTRTTIVRVIRGRLPRIDRLLSSSFKQSSSASNQMTSVKSKTSLNMTTSSGSTGSSNISSPTMVFKKKAQQPCKEHPSGYPAINGCNHISCQAVIESPLGKDSTPHHIFHHQHIVPRLSSEKMSPSSNSQHFD